MIRHNQLDCQHTFKAHKIQQLLQKADAETDCFSWSLMWPVDQLSFQCEQDASPMTTTVALGRREPAAPSDSDCYSGNTHAPQWTLPTALIGQCCLLPMAVIGRHYRWQSMLPTWQTLIGYDGIQQGQGHIGPDWRQTAAYTELSHRHQQPAQTQRS